jgi:DNA-binding CsgD family transcriptional regulator
MAYREVAMWEILTVLERIGQSRKHTAKQLRISPATVASHTERTYRKLGIASKGAPAAALFQTYREMEPKEGG